MPTIEFQDVSVLYAPRKKETVRALNHFRATFRANEVSVILGSSGSGKTTLLKTILGSVPYEGKIVWDGADLAKYPLQNLALSYVSQEFSLYPYLTVFDNIAFPLKMLGAKAEEIRKRVEEITAKLHIRACLTRRPTEISLGQQQRVALARALIKRPDVCLFDEPLANLDVRARLGVRAMLKAYLSATRATFLYVTHDIEEALVFADRLFVIESGELAAEGTAREIYESTDPRVHALIHSAEEEYGSFAH